MITFLILLFIIGYAAIVFEHSIEINKTASALLCGVLLWTVFALYTADKPSVVNLLSHHLASISEILFFLLAAMTIVELVDAHNGFYLITQRIKSDNAVGLMLIVGLISFFLSAILDNLTTAIVMVTLLRKLVANHQLRMVFAGLVIIAANAGGAWSPIGDVTTTMLWIGGQITALQIIKTVFLPSLVSLLVPMALLAYKLRGTTLTNNITKEKSSSMQHSSLMFFFGIGSLLFVPVFKSVTYLPPYLGMLLGLAMVWILSEIIHKNKDEEDRKAYTVAHALSKIDVPSILFFLGILLAIACLEATEVLTGLAHWLDEKIGNQNIIVVAIGLASAIIDNVPLVAASMGMYSLATYPTDHSIWEFLAYCAGTGGSILIIGSAAGVAVMGMEKISFLWYLKRFSLIAALGYFAGAAVYLLMYHG